MARRPDSAGSKTAWDDDELDGAGGQAGSSEGPSRQGSGARSEAASNAAGSRAASNAAGSRAASSRQSAKSRRSKAESSLGRRSDEMPAAMESELYVDGEVRVVGEKYAGKKQTSDVMVAEEDGGCLSSLSRGVRCLWSTREMNDTTGDKDLHVKTTLRELAVYIIFLVIICIITFGMTSSNMYYYTKVMQDLFTRSAIDASTTTTFEGMSSIKDQWKFLQGQLITALYWDQWYNGDNVVPEERGYIYHENKLLGVPRIRQVKVRNDSCAVHTDFRDEIKTCYDEFAPATEDKYSFGPHNGSAWSYSTEEELKGTAYGGKLGSYSGGGFFTDLTLNKTEVEIMLNTLYQKLWITRGTRAMFIDFTTYNANINLFCVVRLVVEFPPTGGAFPSSNFRTVKLLRYVDAFDYFIAACEALFVIFLIYYTVEESLEIKKHKWSYFNTTWNWLDVIVLSIGYLSMIFSVYRFVKVNEILDNLLERPNEYADFDFLSRWQMNFNNAMAIMVFFAWIKVFKYISFNKTMTQLSSTLSRCAKDLAGFAVMFSIIFLAFAQLGYLIFGTQVEDFRTFPDSIFTLFRIILGDFNFQALEQADRVLGPLFFILYVFFVFFVLINMFLAIINDTYSEVKSDLGNQESEFELGEFFKKNYGKVLQKMNIKKDKIVDIQDALRSANTNGDKHLDFEEWRRDLKNRGYAENEIEAVFAKYDTDGDRQLDETEQKKMFADLEGQKEVLDKEMNEMDEEGEGGGRGGRGRGGAGGVSYEEFVILSRRVDRMEHSIGSIVSKIDAVLVKLEAMEKAKMKRRECMSKLLDSINESDASEEQKRVRMEQMVREELDRWDQDSARPASSRAGSDDVDL